jgi:hypothetical protein
MTAADKRGRPFNEGRTAMSRIGVVSMVDEFASAFALGADGSWAGLPNNRGGQSFICFSLVPNVNYLFGSWTFDPRIAAVHLYGPDSTPLGTLNGVDPRAPAPQSGTVTGLPVGPALVFNFIPG